MMYLKGFIVRLLLKVHFCKNKRICDRNWTEKKYKKKKKNQLTTPKWSCNFHVMEQMDTGTESKGTTLSNFNGV